VQNLRLSAVLAGGLLLAPLSAAVGQTTNIAYASAPRSEFVVFFDSNTGELPSAASKTIHMAAKAAKSASTVRITGRADQAEAVRKELVREGIPAESIVVAYEARSPLPKPADGLKDPLNRRVEISF
jgi:outer membrane protein OmpA-like peptidoglycan-associated protein